VDKGSTRVTEFSRPLHRTGSAITIISQVMAATLNRLLSAKSTFHGYCY